MLKGSGGRKSLHGEACWSSLTTLYLKEGDLVPVNLDQMPKEFAVLLGSLAAGGGGFANAGSRPPPPLWPWPSIDHPIDFSQTPINVPDAVVRGDHR